ncbi:cytochrome [Marmoricola sp. Leaf446]|uniref:cytochrome P450 n=1 Tax=Marmoricola sp. Leaf446 TaxID=1736379 RepID=UPI0006F94A94|nr:cytochrome P450 [Marmoricola sp. Leaf446]KQT93563.1 cytochrome [Marmoricola sp. Leaf446]
MSGVRAGLEGQVASTLRWGLGHALPRWAIRGSARRGDLHGRLIEATASSDAAPLELFEEVRADGPLHRSQFAYVTASLPTVKEVLTSNDVRAGVDIGSAPGPLGRLSTWAGRRAPIGPLTPPSLLVTEPPDHTRYRKLVTRVFSARAVQQLRERTEQIATELLDELEADARAGHHVDLVQRYCALLPVTVIAEILGVPAADRDRVLRFGEGAAPSLDLGLGWRHFREVEASLTEFERWLHTHLEDVRRSPGADLLSQLVTARDEEGRGLDDAELKATAGLVLAAGFETTVNLLGNGIWLLHEHPEQLQALRDDPALWSNAVDEVLRHDPPVLLTGRTVVRDTELAGTRVPRGAVVTTLLAGANRDPEVFTDPDVFDVARPNAGDHVSFSSGRHYCLGAALARMEGEVGLRAVFDRFPDLALEPGARRRPTRILRGWGALPARLQTQHVTAG